MANLRGLMRYYERMPNVCNDCGDRFDTVAELTEHWDAHRGPEVITGDGEDAPELRPLPVEGYITQSSESVEMVNQNKRTEEAILRLIDRLEDNSLGDGRWLAVARTHIEQGYMALNRAIFRPARVVLPGDDRGQEGKG